MATVHHLIAGVWLYGCDVRSPPPIPPPHPPSSVPMHRQGMVDARVATVVVAAGDYYFNSVPFMICDGVGTKIVFDVGFVQYPWG